MIVNVPAKFSSSDLLDLLQAQGEEGEGLSCREIARQCGRSTGWVRNRLLEMSERGRLRVLRKRDVRVDGTPCLVPAYSLLPDGGGQEG